MYEKRFFMVSITLLASIVFAGILAGCSDTIDKSPLASIPDTSIPTEIPPVSSGGKGIQIKGGSIESNRATLFIRFEDVMYKGNDIWFRLTSAAGYNFQESLNKSPNNFINDITYAYMVPGLTAGTSYTASIVMGSEKVSTTFTTLSR